MIFILFNHVILSNVLTFISPNRFKIPLIYCFNNHVDMGKEKAGYMSMDKLSILDKITLPKIVRSLCSIDLILIYIYMQTDILLFAYPTQYNYF